MFSFSNSISEFILKGTLKVQGLKKQTHISYLPPLCSSFFTEWPWLSSSGVPQKLSRLLPARANPLWEALSRGGYLASALLCDTLGVYGRRVYDSGAYPQGNLLGRKLLLGGYLMRGGAARAAVGPQKRTSVATLCKTSCTVEVSMTCLLFYLFF